MAVVINEFEVELSPPTGREAPGAVRPAPPPGPSTFQPQDIRDVLRHEQERQARLFAH